jgi:outer membrane protein insertion porin family
VFKRFFGGGLGSVRGFEQGSLGPRDADGTAEGGSRKLTLNAELLTPFPGAGNDRTLRLFGFVDAGSISGSDALNANASSLRSSAGVGLSWISPVGPLRLAYAKPIKKYEGDKTQTMQFQIGTTF